MACTHLGIIILSIAALAVRVQGQIAVGVEISKPEANVGDAVDVRCHVTNKEKVNFYVVWVKKVGETETEIGTNRKINQPFDQTKRYAADVEFKVDNDLSDVTFVLHITDVGSSDSGELGCKIPKADLEAFSDLTVKVPFASLAITSKHLDGSHHVTYSNGQEVFFDEEERRTFYCRATGGYPRPIMSMSLGDKDMKSEFNHSVDLIGTGQEGLKEQTYDIEMSNPALEITYEFSNKTLTCSASIPGTDFSNTTSINIQLNGYKPQFICPPVKLVALHDENVNLTCKVIADPPINESATTYYWKRLSTGNDTINPGEILGHIEAMLEEGKTLFEKKMTLKIDHIFNQHFRTYYFETANRLGSVTYGIDLQRNLNVKTTPQPTEGESNMDEEQGSKDNLDGASPLVTTSAGLVILMMTIALLA